MKRACITLLLLGILQTGYAQNVGINTATPQGVLDINGDIIIRAFNLPVADGITLAMDVNTSKYSYYRLAGPAANFSIAGITLAADGRIITLLNRSGYVMQLNNEDVGATATNRILTGTGLDITINDKGMVTLQYDAVEQRWIVRSNSKGGTTGGGSGNNWDVNGADIFSTNTGNVGIGTSTPLSKLAIQTGTGQTGWTHTGTTGSTTIIVDESIGGVSSSLGTSSDHPFRLKANGQGMVHLYPNGKVVVGSNAFAPAVNGRLTIESEGIGYGLTHTNGLISVGSFVGGSPAAGWLGTISNHPLNFFADNGGALMTILSNGSVGIATTSPAAKLHLNGNMKINFDNTIEFGAGVPGKEVNAGKIGYQTFTPGALDIIGAGTVSGNRRIKFWNEGGGEFSGNVLFSNSVGIGTAINASYRLSVNGNIRSKEVVVETGWADYVFEKNYPLIPLEQLEQFIRQNKHLPNIPSAKAIQENGLLVGDTQRRMMEKIEELTLYVIALKKEIDQLKNQTNTVVK